MGEFVTANGFVRKPYTEIRADIQRRFKDTFGQGFDLTPDSPNGHLIDNMAMMVDDMYSMGQEVYDNLSPSNATGSGVDSVLGYSGLTRLSPTKLSGPVCFFTDGSSSTSVPAGTAVIRQRGSLRLTTRQAVSVSKQSVRCLRLTSTETGAVSGTVTIGFGTGSFTISGANPTQAFLRLATAITVATAPNTPRMRVATEPGGVTMTIYTGGSTGLDPFTVTSVPSWMTMMVGNEVDCVADEAGAQTAEAGEVNTLESTVSGIVRVENMEALQQGTDEETDTSARQRVVQFNRSGKDVCTEQAIEAHLINDVAGVSYAKVSSNRTMVTNSAGQPPKSFECIVVGGDDDDVAKCILDSMPAGIEPYGTTEVGVVDDNGDENVVRFSRPAGKFLWLYVTYTGYSEETLPDNVDDAIRQSLVNAAPKEFTIGRDVMPNRLRGYVLTSSMAISGCTVKAALVDTASETPESYTEDILPIDGHAYAMLDTSRITIARLA